MKQHKLNLKYVAKYNINRYIVIKKDFEALKFSGVTAVLLAAFFSYHGFCNEECMAAPDKPTKFILVLGKMTNI